MGAHGDELRADLQQYYGIDLDDAMAGAHSARHVAALLAQLPPDCRVARAEDPDAAWTLTDSLLATVANALHTLMWGMSDPKKRGQRPAPIGPSWMRGKRTRTLDARAMPVDELMQELTKPRR